MKNSDKQPSWKLDCLNRGRAAAPPSSALCTCLCCCFELCHLQVLPLFLLLHCALFTLAQLDLPPLPVHFLPAASLLALLFQHYMVEHVFTAVCFSSEGPWLCSRENGKGGNSEAAEAPSLQGMMLTPSQNKAKWPNSERVPQLFLLKPHTPQ